MKRPIKILYVVSGGTMTGGATKSFLTMLREARGSGVEYEVVCPEEEGLAQYLRSEGVRVHVVPYRLWALPQMYRPVDAVKWLPRLLMYWWINLKAVRSLTEIVRNFNPDIVHENSSAVNIGYKLARKMDVPYVMHIREYGWPDFKLAIPDVRKRISDARTYVIAITRDLMEYRNLNGNERAEQIYNGIISADTFRYRAEKSGYFLYAGKLNPGKGVSDLIDAYIEYARDTDNPLELHLAGESTMPGYEEALRGKVSDAGLDEKVKWLGVRDDVGSLMGEATATIVPSYREGLGRVLPEAMANGSLCVGRYTGGTREQIDNGRDLTGGDIALHFDTTGQLTGILSEITEKKRNADAFAENGEYHQMVMRSQAAVREFFTEDKFGLRLMDFYHRILIENGWNSDSRILTQPTK